MRRMFYIKKSEEDLFKDLTLCRNCGKEVFYGDLINNTGHSACPDCYESLRLNIMKIRETDYDEYRTLDHFYLLPDHVYNKLVEYYKLKYLVPTELIALLLIDGKDTKQQVIQKLKSIVS